MNIYFTLGEGEDLLRTVNEEARRHKIIEIMETAFDCYAQNGFSSVGIKAIADACGCNVASLYQYFEHSHLPLLLGTNVSDRSFFTQNSFSA